MQWKSFHLAAAAVNQSPPTIGRASRYWQPHLGQGHFEIVTIENCVRTLFAHLSQLSYENSSGCAAVNLWNTINYNFIFERKKWKFSQIWTSAEKCLKTFGQIGPFEGETCNFLSYCMSHSHPPTKKWSKWNAKLRRHPFFLGRDKVETCFEQTEILLTVSIYPIKWWIGYFATRCHSYILLSLICQQHQQLDPWAIPISQLLIYWWSVQIKALSETDFKGFLSAVSTPDLVFHLLIWFATSWEALSVESPCSRR